MTPLGVIGRKMKVCLDSRLIRPGEYFVAVKGEKFDGHQFVDEALKKGAAGVLEEEELYELAKKRLEKIKPEVIAVTGSTAKTSTKEAIAAVLSEKFKILKSAETLNTKLGLAAEIVNNLKKSHQKLVVEVGMDRLGEIKKTCQLIKPRIGVVTFINPTHQEKLKTLENIIRAKGELLEALPKDGVAILNWDDENVRSLSRSFANAQDDIRAVWYGKNHVAATHASPEIHPDFITVKIPLLGEHQIYNALAAAAVGKVCGLTAVEINSGLKKLKPLKGRLNLLDGINGAKILDDTYNSSPKSAAAALKVLKEFPAKRKIAVLGDMLELGSFEEEAHRLVGQMVAESKVDFLITIGERAKVICSSAVYCAPEGGRTKVRYYSTGLHDEVFKLLKNKIKLRKGDIILVKGSRGMQMERIVEKLLKDPSKAKDLLVCQDIRWKG